MSGYGLAGSSDFWKVTWVWGLAGSEFFYDDEVDICSGCNQLERKASVKSQNLIYSLNNFENDVSKTSSIYSGMRKMDIRIIGKETNSSFLPDSQIYPYYFLHLWLLSRTVPFGDALERDCLPISSWISKTPLQLKGCHLNKQRDFRHFRYQFFPFFKL